MNNLEKYVDSISEAICINKVINNVVDCMDCEFSKVNDIGVSNCDEHRIKDWLLSEYKEPEVDWSKVVVDAPILVSDDNNNYKRKYFAQYKDGEIYAWAGGTTSWTSNGVMNVWNYAKLV